MRIAGAGFAAIVAAIALVLNTSARADDASPFPSPSPVESVPPANGGYAEIRVSTLSANGGMIPAATASSTPRPFTSAQASGYSFEVLGRLSDSYVATLNFTDSNIHGDDKAITTRFDTAVLYDSQRNNVAVGIAYTSYQRSTIPSSSNGFGLAAMLLPDFGRKISPYASFTYFPSLPAPGMTRAALTAVRFGVVLTHSSQNGIFERIGYTAQRFGTTASSPTSLSGAEIGIGATF